MFEKTFDRVMPCTCSAEKGQQPNGCVYFSPACVCVCKCSHTDGKIVFFWQDRERYPNAIALDYMCLLGKAFIHKEIFPSFAHFVLSTQICVFLSSRRHLLSFLSHPFISTGGLRASHKRSLTSTLRDATGLLFHFSL